MASKITKKEKQNIIEHYAYCTSDKCVKLDAVNQLLGGLYDHHNAVLYRTAKYIFNSFVKVSHKLEKNELPTVKVDTIKSEDYDDEQSIQYRIHIFNRKRCTTRRKAMWLSAGILMKLPNGLGYTRIFRMPCKLDIFSKCICLKNGHI